MTALYVRQESESFRRFAVFKDGVQDQYPQNKYVFFWGAYRQEISFCVTFLGGGGMGAVVDVGVSGDSCCFWLQKASRDIRNINWMSPFPE